MNTAGYIPPPRTERDPLTDRVLGLALEVHRALGPGLLESAYSECLAHEFTLAGVDFSREVPVPLVYKGKSIPCAYRLDFLVEDKLILEVKSVESLEQIHQAQLLTYLRLTGKKNRPAPELQRNAVKERHHAPSIIK